QGGPIPERFVGTTSKPKVPRERREDGPAAAEVRWPALRLARPQKKLPRLTVTAFTNLILTEQHQSRGSTFYQADLTSQIIKEFFHAVEKAL
ncbi:hypothetical protein, partial [Pantoea agglomerans]|uniref:hypothetical protein n=1 Tax=Enterobacter agglomerans TaxID=549 RepID=UPI00320ABF97